MSEAALRLVEPASAAPVTLVDSCVLLDIATDDPRWGEWSENALTQALDSGRVVINPVVYAEVSIGYDTVEELDRVLPNGDYEREPLPYEAGFLAGKAFLAYRRRGGQKRSPLPDFYIGAHAAVQSYRLLTRDTKRYRTYFPRLELITPP
ncbi:PIN domain-containing protein [Jiangella aurantiaca]|uniref:PIN domain-containing protein n=1 Tax=Jiangella aurantiaca TaxID=2530373 RepID=A0A4R5A297_9ACTN|nr:type II toxin-antitoxin system VapC family toxin [Jiangella aurantiaca]TDD65923.1 PIN domain-containing protein [Jiangella aurantiaca]